MDNVERYKSLIKSLLTAKAKLKPGHGEIETLLQFDDEHLSYQLVHTGWSGDWRIHGPVIHARLKNGKIWLEHDGTEEGFASLLLDAGVPKGDIVLAFHAPQQRRFTDFAVA